MRQRSTRQPPVTADAHHETADAIMTDTPDAVEHARDRQALPRRPGERSGRLRAAARRDSRAAGRERRRQEHADEHPRRAVPARRRRRSSSTASRSRSARRATRSRPAWAWSTSTSCSCQSQIGHRKRAARASTGRASGSTSAQVRARRSPSSAERYGLPVDPRAKVWQLSVGEQQRVEILKMLYRGADVLILDEPTAVLAPQEVDGPVPHAARRWRPRGKSIVFISHKLQRGAGDRRPRDGAAARACHRRRPPDGGQSASASWPG